MRSPAIRTLTACAAIVLAAIALYARAGSAWFFEDDLQWLAGTLTFEPRHLLDISSQVHFYRPIVALYFWAATPLFDGSPVLFHWANILLHAANAVLVFAVARAIGFARGWAFAASMFFVTMPAYVDAIAWVSALAEAVMTFFGCISLYAMLRARREGAVVWAVVSIVSFAAALMTHESAAVLLPLLVMADWAFVRRHTEWRAEWISRLRFFMPHALLLAVYLALDASINQRSYLVEEGHYRIGFHAVPHLLGYVVSLYVGKKNIASFVVVSAALTLLLLRGSRRVVFATAWLILAILPFAFFTWGNTSRYAYTPAIGMALLLTEAVAWLDHRIAPMSHPRVRRALIGLVVAVVAVRFATFTRRGVENFTRSTDRYRRIAVQVHERYPDPPRGSSVAIDRATIENLKYRYLEGLVRWEFHDPTLTLVAE